MAKHPRSISELREPSQPEVAHSDAPSDPRLPVDPLAPATIASVTGESPVIDPLLSPAVGGATAGVPAVDRRDAAELAAHHGLTQTDAALLRQEPRSAAAAETVSADPTLISSPGVGSPAVPRGGVPLPRTLTDAGRPAVYDQSRWDDGSVFAPEPRTYAAGRSLRIDGPCLVVVSRVAGFRRSGVLHAARTTYALDHFTAKQLAQMAAEPNLELIAIGGEPVASDA